MSSGFGSCVSAISSRHLDHGIGSLQSSQQRDQMDMSEKQLSVLQPSWLCLHMSQSHRHPVLSPPWLGLWLPVLGSQQVFSLPPSGLSAQGSFDLPGLRHSADPPLHGGLQSVQWPFIQVLQPPPSGLLPGIMTATIWAASRCHDRPHLGFWHGVSDITPA